MLENKSTVNKQSTARVIKKDNSADNIPVDANDIETICINNPADKFILFYNELFDNLSNNARLLAMYYCRYMNIRREDGTPWKFLSSHIRATLNFGISRLEHAVRELREAGYMTVQYLPNTKEKYGGLRRTFSAKPIFNDFDKDPSKRVHLKGYVGILETRKPTESSSSGSSLKNCGIRNQGYINNTNSTNTESYLKTLDPSIEIESNLQLEECLTKEKQTEAKAVKAVQLSKCNNPLSTYKSSRDRATTSITDGNSGTQLEEIHESMQAAIQAVQQTNKINPTERKVAFKELSHDIVWNAPIHVQLSAAGIKSSYINNWLLEFTEARLSEFWSTARTYASKHKVDNMAGLFCVVLSWYTTKPCR